MDTTTVTFRVKGMHCGSCALLIDDTLADLPGVRDTRTTHRGRTTVELDASQTSPQDVITAITRLGYRATTLST
jgi:copper chaperone